MPSTFPAHIHPSVVPPDLHEIPEELHALHEEVHEDTALDQALEEVRGTREELRSVLLQEYLRDVGNDERLTSALQRGMPASTRTEFAHLGDIFVIEGKHANALNAYIESGDTARLRRFAYYLLERLQPLYAETAFLAAGIEMPRDAFRTCAERCHERGLLHDEEQARTIAGAGPADFDSVPDMTVH